MDYSEGLKYAKSIGAFFSEMSVKLKQNTDTIFDTLIKHAEVDLLEERLSRKKHPDKTSLLLIISSSMSAK